MKKRDNISGESSDHRINESSPKRRWRMFPQALSQSLTPLLTPIYKKHGFAEHRILTQWHSVVGDDLASCSTPLKLATPRGAKAGGTLHISVAAPRALELQHMAPVIIERINSYFGYAAVSALRLVQAATTPKPKKAAPPAPAQDNAFSAQAAACDDPELRDALMNLGRALGNAE